MFNMKILTGLMTHFYFLLIQSKSFKIRTRKLVGGTTVISDWGLGIMVLSDKLLGVSGDQSLTISGKCLGPNKGITTLNLIVVCSIPVPLIETYIETYIKAHHSCTVKY